MTINKQDIQTMVGNDEDLTMYRLANVLSEVTGTRVREQYLYNYRKAGRITVNGSGRISQAGAVKFINEFVERAEKREEARLAKLVEETSEEQVAETV